VQRGPLTQDLAVWPGVAEFVAGDACQRVGGDVADAVAAGLDGVHLHAGQVFEDVRNPLQARPVELDILARTEVTVALVVFAGDVGQHPQLPRGQQAIGNGYPQHGRVPLQVQAVHQAQGAELFVADLALQITPGMFPELDYALVYQGLIVIVV